MQMKYLQSLSSVEDSVCIQDDCLKYCITCQDIFWLLLIIESQQCCAGCGWFTAVQCNLNSMLDGLSVKRNRFFQSKTWKRICEKSNKKEIMLKTSKSLQSNVMHIRSDLMRVGPLHCCSVNGFMPYKAFDSSVSERAVSGVLFSFHLILLFVTVLLRKGHI